MVERHNQERKKSGNLSGANLVKKARTELGNGFY